MSKNIKYQIVFMIFTILLSLLFSLLLMPRYVMDMATSYNKLSIYENTETDYVIMNPSKEQVLDFNSNDNIVKIVPYYEYILDSSLTRDMVPLVVLDDFNNLEYTTFTNKRLIRKSKKTYENPLLIDYNLSQLLNLNLDDTIDLSFYDVKVTFHISAIYETDIYYSRGLAIANLTESVKQMISENNTVQLKYSAAYLSAKDAMQCWNELESYKPLGIKKERIDFNNDLDYENYLTNFNKTDYRTKMKNYVLDYNKVKQNEDGIIANQILKISLFLFLDLALSMIVLLIINHFKLKQYVLKDLKYGVMKKHYIIQNVLLAICSAILNLGIYLLVTYLCLDSTLFISPKLFGYASICFVIFAFLMCIGSYLMNMLLLKEKVKNVDKYKTKSFVKDDGDILNNDNTNHGTHTEKGTK